MKETTIRPAQPSDFPRIMAMMTTMLDSRSADELRECSDAPALKQRLHHQVSKRWVLLALSGEESIGFLAWHIGMTKPCEKAVRYSEIDTVCVHPYYRWQGVGDQLYSAFMVERKRLAIGLIHVSQMPHWMETEQLKTLGIVDYRQFLDHPTTQQNQWG